MSAVYTPLFPLLAMYGRKISAVPGKRPAVMQGPFHLYLRMLLNPGKQHLNIDVIAMDVMKPHKVRLVFLRPLEKPPGCSHRTESMLVQDPCSEHVKNIVHRISNANSVLLIFLRDLIHTAIRNANFISVFDKLVCQIRTDSAGTANPAYNIDEQNSHACTPNSRSSSSSCVKKLSSLKCFRKYILAFSPMADFS